MLYHIYLLHCTIAKPDYNGGKFHPTTAPDPHMRQVVGYSPKNMATTWGYHDIMGYQDIKNSESYPTIQEKKSRNPAPKRWQVHDLDLKKTYLLFSCSLKEWVQPRLKVAKTLKQTNPCNRQSSPLLVSSLFVWVVFWLVLYKRGGFWVE